MDVSFCVEALEEALTRYGKPEIFNTDQGKPVHVPGFHQRAAARGDRDQRGWPGRLARQCRGRAPLAIAHKYEEVYLRAYGAVSDARESIGRYFEFYSGKRPHSSLGAKTPDQMYFNNLRIAMAA
jgi:putative transposase